MSEYEETAQPVEASEDFHDEPVELREVVGHDKVLKDAQKKPSNRILLEERVLP